jgi:hypothetical protein
MRKCRNEAGTKEAAGPAVSPGLRLRAREIAMISRLLFGDFQICGEADLSCSHELQHAAPEQYFLEALAATK